MILRAYRIVHIDHLSSAFSGQGAFEYPGRFNPKSTYVVYCTESLSLAMLEIFVHMPYSKYKDKINDLYRFIPCTFDDAYVKILEIKDLPSDWNSYPAPFSTRELGKKWIESEESLILKVPSVISPVECNFLINPKHPDFSNLIIDAAQEIKFDERLILSCGVPGDPSSTK